MAESGRITLSMSRRTVVLGAASVGLLGAAYQGLRQVGRYPAPSQEYKVLTRKLAAILGMLGNHLLPPGGPLPGSGGDDETLLAIDAFLEGLPDQKRQLLIALPLVFEHGTGLNHFGARCMTHLPEQTCESYLAAWAGGDSVVKAQLWSALKTLYGVYFERTDVMAAMGYQTSCGGPR